jgi:hypothetical protein
MKLRGTIIQRPGPVTRPVTIEKWRLRPDLYMTAIFVEGNGKQIVQFQLLDGESVYIRDDGRARRMSKQAAAEMLANTQAEDLERLDFLADERCRVTSIPDAKVEGRDAAGVLVQFKGRRDAKLYFDKATGLLVKREHQMLDSVTGKPITQEVILGDWRDEGGGVKRYQRLNIYRDGREFLDVRVIERNLLYLREWDPLRNMGDFPPFVPVPAATRPAA